MTEHNNHWRAFDIERSEARLDEAIACLKRQFMAVEDAVEELKRSHQQPAPLPRPRRPGENA